MKKTNLAAVLFSILLLTLSCVGSQPGSRERGAPAPAPASQPDEEIGSLRHARVAYPMSGEPTPLTYFAREVSDEERQELSGLAPNVTVIGGLSRDEAIARAGEAHGADGFYATPEFLRRAENLVWVQAMSAGVDRFMGTTELVDNDRIVLTNLRGVHGPAIADHAFAMLLAMTRDLRFHLVNQAQGRWVREDSGTRPVALEGRTMLVVGLGGIGTEVAKRAHGFGMRVIATRRSETPGPEFVERVGTPKDLLSMLPEADVVAICLPLTTETEGLFDAAAFGAMKEEAYLVNVGRGRIVVTDALLAALESGRLAGACLDVTDPEPLPADHPLWKHPRVIITPHVSSDAEVTDRRAWTLFRENLRRFGAGQPLRNVVDKGAGY